MATYPTSVNVDEAAITKLSDVLKTAYAEIVSEIDGATDFGVKNRRQILAQIEQILEEAGVDVDEFVRDTLPDYYKEGADQAVSQLKNADAPVDVKYGLNQVHKEAITALIDDTAKSFGESLTGVGRSAQALLGKAVRDQITQQLATGKIQGAALKEVKRNVVGIMQEQGLAALIDKGGKQWSLDRYAEMLIRTKAVEARNRGMINRIAENGYDLVEVSSHGADDVCGDWEGKILSINGDTPGYPTVADAEADGLFHPNCKHAINVIVPELSAITHAYDDGVDTYDLEDVEEIQQKTDKYTDKPLTVYRGDGKQTPASLVDSYGKGKYYTFDADYAENFGVVTQSVIRMKNPLILRDQTDLDNATRAMIDQGFEKLSDYATSKGFDGIIDLSTDILLKLAWHFSFGAPIVKVLHILYVA